jgi:serine/threonine protein phosphatase PrpC
MLARVRSAQLLGRDHLEQGRIAAVAEVDVAIAISRGGAKKTYRYKEANEDAVCFAHGAAGSVLAVADGHAGAEASELALRVLLAEAAPGWTEQGVGRNVWAREAEALVGRIHTEIITAGVPLGSEARTTLSIACVQPQAGYCGWISAGDSHVFAIGEEPQELGPWQEPLRFLGSPRGDLSELALRCGSCEISELRAIVLATDGLSERGIGVADPPAAAARAVADARHGDVALRPIATARGLAQAAITAQQRQEAGDNVATAVCWLADR